MTLVTFSDEAKAEFAESLSKMHKDYALMERRFGVIKTALADEKCAFLPQYDFALRQAKSLIDALESMKPGVMGLGIRRETLKGLVERLKKRDTILGDFSSYSDIHKFHMRELPELLKNASPANLKKAGIIFSDELANAALIRKRYPQYKPYSGGDPLNCIVDDPDNERKFSQIVAIQHGPPPVGGDSHPNYTVEPLRYMMSSADELNALLEAAMKKSHRSDIPVRKQKSL